MKLTVFTPAYNRADKLYRVYDSLKMQGTDGFEWLIVDDGSTDNTRDVIAKFEKEEYFPVRYFYQENGGKHRAYNKALQMSEGEYFFCVDSDDWLAKDALTEIINAVKQNPNECFIVAYKTNEKGVRLSDEFPTGMHSINFHSLSSDYQCKGEFSLVFKTEFAKMFPYPTFEGEKFITESVVYDRMALERKAILLPKILTVCEYQLDGLSNNLNTIMRENPAGYCLYFMQRIDLQSNFLSRITVAGKYQCFSIFAKEKKTAYAGTYPALVGIAKLLGLVFWLYYKLRRGF